MRLYWAVDQCNNGRISRWFPLHLIYDNRFRAAPTLQLMGIIPALIMESDVMYHNIRTDINTNEKIQNRRRDPRKLIGERSTLYHVWVKIMGLWSSAPWAVLEPCASSSAAPDDFFFSFGREPVFGPKIDVLMDRRLLRAPENCFQFLRMIWIYEVPSYLRFVTPAGGLSTDGRVSGCSWV